MSDGPEIREHMEVVGSDGGHVGTVDRLEAGRIKLTRGDDPGGAGAHRAVPLGLVASAEAGRVRLTLTAQQARALAAGGLDPRDVAEDATAPVGGDESGAARAAGAGAGAGVPDDGGGPGGPGARSNIGSTGGPHGDGTGGGGTSSQGYLGGGPGIADDPNMDPGASRGPLP